MRAIFLASLMAMAMVLGVSNANAQFFDKNPGHEVLFGVGGFDVLDEYTAGAFELEYRAPYRAFDLVRPLAGTFVTTEGSGMVYGGFGLEFAATDRISIMPFTSMGAYWLGGGKDLGGTFEFRSGLEVGYFLDNGDRIAISGLHISNANIYDKNPGTEILTLRYGLNF